MALINGQMFGDMSGKLGGMVFTRNKAGKTIRAYVNPTDAKSGQQITQRSRFATVVSVWATLTDIAKGAWTSFANSLFSPKKPKVGGSYSGYQAFTSVNSLLNFSKAHDYTATFTPTTVDLNLSSFPAQLVSPPTTGFSSNIQSSTGTAIALTLKSFSLNTLTGACIGVLTMDPGPQAAAPVFENPITDKKVGFSFFGSTVLSPGANSCSNYEAYCLGTIPPPGAITGWSSLSDLTFNWTIPSDYFGNLKGGFSAGQQIFVTVYAVGDEGQSAKIGMLKVTLT
jgi:hypothetical protein